MCLGVIFQWRNTLKVSIELPATSKQRRVLKATKNPNTKKQTNVWISALNSFRLAIYTQNQK